MVDFNHSLATIDNLSSGPPESANSWVLGDAPAIRQIARHAQRAADAQCVVLISGETGTSKEIWARSLHQLGPRAGNHYVPVDCAALTTTLA